MWNSRLYPIGVTERREGRALGAIMSIYVS